MWIQGNNNIKKVSKTTQDFLNLQGELTEEDARDLSKRALQFKNERGRLPDINSADAWEKRMAEGVAAFARYRQLAKSAQAQGAQSNG